MTSKICGVYKIIHRSGKFYVGSSKNVHKRYGTHVSQLRNQTHHCIKLQRAVNKYGIDEFHLEISDVCATVDEALDLEQYYLNNTDFNLLYNTSRCATGGDLISYHPNKQDIVQRMTNTLKIRYGKMTPQEKKEIYGRPGERNPMFGKCHTDDAKKKISEAAKGNKRALGAVRSEEQRTQLSIAASQRKGNLNPFFGKHHSVETKEKISKRNKGRLPPNTKKVMIAGTVYASITEAAKTMNVVPATIINRIKANKPHYSYC